MPSEYSRNFGSSVGGLRSQSELFSASTSPTESTIRLYSSPSCSATMLIELPHSRGGRPRRRRTSIAVTMRPRRFSEPAISGGASGMRVIRSEEHTSELQSLMRISYAVFCLKKKNQRKKPTFCTLHDRNKQ